MIRIQKNKQIKINIPSFSCDDNAVGEHLDTHPLLKLLNVYGFLAVIGRPGSGKTSLTIALLTQTKPKIYRKTHHHIILFMPKNSIESLKKNPFKGLEHIYHELTDENITSALAQIKGFSEKGEKTLLFLDDMTAHLKSSMTCIQTLKEMIFNRRHLKLNIIITVQSYTNIPLDVRKNIQNCIMFKPAKKEFQLLFDELFETHKKIAFDIMRMTYDKDHNFLFLNVPNQRLFKNWDEIIIRDDCDSDIEL